MQRFILTGAPGAGKTTILQALAELGYSVVPEAATTVIERMQAEGIAHPWTHPDFIGRIFELQTTYMTEIEEAALQFHDRSLVDAYILAVYLGHPVPSELERVIKSCRREGIYESRVFLIESLDFIEHTPARKISLADALEFACLHEKIYRDLGFACQRIAPAPVHERARQVLAAAAGVQPT